MILPRLVSVIVILSTTNTQVCSTPQDTTYTVHNWIPLPAPELETDDSLPLPLGKKTMPFAWHTRDPENRLHFLITHGIRKKPHKRIKTIQRLRCLIERGPPGPGQQERKAHMRKALNDEVKALVIEPQDNRTIEDLLVTIAIHDSKEFTDLMPVLPSPASEYEIAAPSQENIDDKPFHIDPRPSEDF